MSFDIRQFHQVYFEECFEGLEIMDSGSLELSIGTSDAASINAIFRAARSRKGGGTLERQTRRTRLHNSHSLHRHRLPAYGQTQTPACSALGAGRAEMRLLGSTLNGIEPLQ